MIVYVLTFLSVTMLAIVADMQAKARDGSVLLPRSPNLAAISVFIILAAVSGLRLGVGTDYWTYWWNFEFYVQEFLDGTNILGEPGIRFLAWLSHAMGAGSLGMFALAAAITMGLIIRTVWRWSPTFPLGVALIIVTGVWHGTFNGVRQYLACAILFAGHRYIIERKLAKWVFIVGLASLFHISALLAILLYFVPTKKTSVKIQILIIILGIAGLFGSDSIIAIIESVTGDDGLSEGSYVNRDVNIFRVAFAFVPVVLFWLLNNRRAIEDSGAWFYINMLVVYAALFLAASNSAYIARFAIYIVPFLAIGLSWITSVPKILERLLIRGLLITLYAAFMYIDISETSNLVNFQWIFNRE